MHWILLIPHIGALMVVCLLILLLRRQKGSYFKPVRRHLIYTYSAFVVFPTFVPFMRWFPSQVTAYYVVKIGVSATLFGAAAMGAAATILYRKPKTTSFKDTYIELIKKTFLPVYWLFLLVIMILTWTGPPFQLQPSIGRFTGEQIYIPLFPFEWYYHIAGVIMVCLWAYPIFLIFLSSRKATSKKVARALTVLAICFAAMVSSNTLFFGFFWLMGFDLMEIGNVISTLFFGIMAYVFRSTSILEGFFEATYPSVQIGEGERIVALYAAKADKMKVFASYIREGLLNGDKVYYVFPDSDTGLVKEALKKEGVGVESSVKNGSLTLVPASQWWNGVYRAETVDRGMLRLMEEVKRSGYKHLRTLVDYGDIHQMFKDPRDFFAEAIGKTDEKYRQPYLIQLITFSAESLSEEEVQQLRQFYVKSLFITEGFSIEKLEVFSRRLGLRHREMVGRKVLFELDVTSNYEEAVEDFVFESRANGEPVVVFTHRGSGLHSALAPRRAIRFFHLTAQVSVPTACASENEILLPINNTSLLLDTLDKTLKACPQGNISIVFDNLSDLILSIGFEKIYSFLHFALEIIAQETVTALFLFNPTAHEPEVASSLKSLFNSQVTYGKRGLEVIKLPKF